jgi:hypothetical protein
VRAVVNCRVCELATALWLLLVTFCKSSVNPITNPNPSRVTHTRDSIMKRLVTINRITLIYRPTSEEIFQVPAHSVALYRKIPWIRTILFYDFRAGIVSK